MNRRTFVRSLPPFLLLAATGSSVANGIGVHTPTEETSGLPVATSELVADWSPEVIYVDSPYSLGFFVRADQFNRASKWWGKVARWKRRQMKAELRKKIF